MTSCLWLVCTLFAIFGSAYAVLASLLVTRFARQPKPVSAAAEGVTLLKPLYGAEPGLATSLWTFCTQDYGGKMQVVFGVQDPSDPAIRIVGALQKQYPAADLELVTGRRPTGGNPKIANVISMFPAAKHDILILSDSDMRVSADYVARVVALLQKEGTALITCLYRGCALSGFWSRMAAAAVDHHFLPNVLVGTWLGLAQPCFGSTIALRRKTLEAIGGFGAYANTLADDYAMGEAVRRKGLRVEIAPFTIGHTFSEGSFGELWAHELRWAKTIRLVDPGGYLGSIATHPLPFALAALPLSGFSAIAWMILIVTLACRLFIPIQVEKLSGGGKSTIWLSPLRDLLSFAIFIASFMPGTVSWRGRHYSVGPDGTVTPI
ncbi:bacteriohopanetetrol glucosamine biosynthesis glycosyltransferase HpnI [Hyphomicrobium sp.]|uniref:bacteriohopanetetrol glucosamine biosynthesis glycosyltransferase HpnI n=1 Tax=Hyphomicrobium sp. TaxID=82 RepID=UPI000FA87470|nr:bacteriohopanetetrol glucosamine biosynthesis glycosyltransferase HpnI [Hyphomicrobium sp.]RUO98905.1 MAG: glycosyltransferase [Hyphomicrobium sp.]